MHVVRVVVGANRKKEEEEEGEERIKISKKWVQHRNDRINANILKCHMRIYTHGQQRPIVPFFVFVAIVVRRRCDVNICGR